MRIRLVLAVVGFLAIPALAISQDSSAAVTRQPSSSVIRPAATVAWRNYVTVPDGPCGHPMAVQSDCYESCRPCGPLHPICFLHRVGRMLDCLVPCNMCCRGGGCGLIGCGHGGKTWGHCSVCCGSHGGGHCGSGCGRGACGSMFDDCCPPSCTTTTGGQCYGCGTALPGLSDPFLDDPLPPKTDAPPATEVRRTLPSQIQDSFTKSSGPPLGAVSPSPYKIVRPASSAAPVTGQRPATTGAARGSQPSTPSVLRRASNEQEINEPAPLHVDRRLTMPLVGAKSVAEIGYHEVPANPLRR